MHIEFRIVSLLGQGPTLLHFENNNGNNIEEPALPYVSIYNRIFYRSQIEAFHLEVLVSPVAIH